MSTSPIRAATVDAGLRFRIARAGRGPTVVLLHGYGESLVAWRPVFERLRGDMDVTALDLPGHGLTSKPDTGYTTTAMAEAVLRALRAMRLDSIVLVGHSMGGAIAAAIAGMDPRRVRALVLVAPAALGAPPILPDSGRHGAADSAILGAISGFERLRGRLQSSHAPDWLQEHPAALAYSPASDSAYGAALELLLRDFDFAFLTEERARLLPQPTLILWGQLDPVVPATHARRLAAMLPGARLVIIPRSWHRPHVERPDVVAHAIAAFVRGLRHTVGH